MEAFHCVVCDKNLGNSCSFAKHNKSVKHCLKAQSQPSDLLKRIAELEQENKQLKQMNMNLSETLVNITRISSVPEPTEPIAEPKKVKKVRPSPIVAPSPVVEVVEPVMASYRRKRLDFIVKEVEKEIEEMEEQKQYDELIQKVMEEEEKIDIHEPELIEMEVPTEDELIRDENKKKMQEEIKKKRLQEIERDEREAEESLQQFERERLIRITQEQKELKEYKKQQKEQEKKEKKEKKPSKSKRTPEELELFESLKIKYPILMAGDVNCIMKYKMDEKDIDNMVSIRTDLSELKNVNQEDDDFHKDLNYIFELKETDSELLISWKGKVYDIVKKHGL